MKFTVIRELITIVLLSLLIIGGCGGSDGNGENCIDFSVFLNGESLETQTSEWDCNVGEFAFSFAVFEDGTGTTSALGIGEFEFEAGCRNVDFQTLLTFGSLTFQGPVEGGVDSGEAMFTDVTIEIDGVDLGTFDVFCILDVEPDDTV
jgi:hypothetical protein